MEDLVSDLAASPPPAFPPGHFYSPVVDVVDLARHRDRVFDRTRTPLGIDLNDEAQLALLERLSKLYSRLPFSAGKQEGLRYHYENPAFGYGDAIVLACLLMELRPGRMIEVGSGYSSCVTLDINELFLDGGLDLTFVEPYPDLLQTLMKAGDSERHLVIASRVQDLDPSVFDTLEAGDILFIDSTHVTKCNSDVNFEVFDVLPRLKPGVVIHFHDVFYPFEYPEDWFFTENRSWNELYLLRAFLMNNTDYEILFFNHYMHLKHQSSVARAFPDFPRNCGGSLWLRKRA
jgi:hypothetical protein